MDDALERLAAALADRYRIERELGRGGMATVYLAEDLKHHRKVALKVLRSELAQALGPDRFLREIATTAQLDHPHILAVHDSGEADGTLFYVMPYVEGESLRQLLDREGQLPLEEALALTREVADALSHAHSRGIIHRDIKPENILLAGGHARVADFGIAKAVTEAGGDKLTATGISIGTPAYMSPEQASAGSQLDGRSDLYSLGCVLYEMLAGEPVFAGATPWAVMARHRQERIPNIQIARPSVPDALAVAIARALAKVPADRFPSAEAFGAALTGAATGRRLRPPRWLTRASVVLAAAAALYGAAVLWQTRKGVPVPVHPGPVVTILDPTRIAVLYFEDLSPDASLGYVARGLTEDLIGQLSAVNALAVTSPEGVKPYRGSTASVDSIARALSVGSIVGGSVALSGGQLRVRVRLLDAATAEEIFSNALQDRWGELFALQDRVADEVARFLRARLGREIELRQWESGTTSRAAWELVYRAEELADEGSALVRRGRPDAAITRFSEADSLLVEAQRADTAWPEPAMGRARVAYALSFVAAAPSRSGSDAPADTATPGSLLLPAWIERAMAHADHALILAPRSGEALALRGDLRYRLATWTSSGWDDSLVDLAEADLQLALEVRPTLAGAWYSLGELQFRDARFEEASASLAEAYAADAYLRSARDILQFLFYASLEIEQFEQARAWCETGLRRFPDDPRFMDCEITLLGWSGRGTQHITAARAALDAIARRDTLRTLQPKWAHERLWIAALYARTGMEAEALAFIDSATALVRRDSLVSDGPHIEAYVRLLLGQKRQALRLLTDVVRASPDMRRYLARSPWFRTVRADPGFAALFGAGP